ncbi:hypothetical protein PPL_06663 [Heterostelium album PN500]|uniref:Uncharacterized protein n=1 Tax=Heterostelium pallidum (strain ATCC 26659 / Pp 5 / PN500) TaxID=670386 RepID=D3BFD0_HETP5|nr:hypothetical protein PPL_06663 [Heterostelium album PN500]EFA79844.1 hypothetical protein PPL_06663 [Heterostelium album PN500]|eukprot:XP_020431965.1 hypothetical protein PPL_06663 [Heterostelium album PN500]
MNSILCTTTSIIARNPSMVLSIRPNYHHNTDINVTSLATGNVIRSSGLVNLEAFAALNSVDPDTVNLLADSGNWSLISFNYITLESQKVAELTTSKSFGFSTSSLGYEPSLQLVMSVMATNHQFYLVNWDFKNSIFVGCYDGKGNYYILFNPEAGNWRITSYDIFGKGLSPVQYEMLEGHHFYKFFMAVSYRDSQQQQLYGVEVTNFTNGTAIYELYGIFLDSSSNTANVIMLHQAFTTRSDYYAVPAVANSQSIVFYTINQQQQLVTTIINLSNLQTTIYTTNTDYAEDVTLFLL